MNQILKIFKLFAMENSSLQSLVRSGPRILLCGTKRQCLYGRHLLGPCWRIRRISYDNTILLQPASATAHRLQKPVHSLCCAPVQSVPRAEVWDPLSNGRLKTQTLKKSSALHCDDLSCHLGVLPRSRGLTATSPQRLWMLFFLEISSNTLPFVT